MNKSKNEFSLKYDQLFEKPKVQLFEEKKIKILVLIGVIATGCVITLPYLFLLVNSSIISSSQKRIDKIEKSQPFEEIPIFKENLMLQFPPNYGKVEKYNMHLDGDKLDFGNGYALKMRDFSSLESKLSDFSLKPEKGYDSVNNILLLKSTVKQFPIANDGKNHFYDKSKAFNTDIEVPIRVTGNLLESMDMAKMKEKGSFLTLFQQQNVGDVKTGLVVNSSPAHGLSDDLGEITQSYLVMTKYWLFPDGVGVMVDIGNNYLGNISDIDDFSTLDSKKLQEIDEFTNDNYSWIESHFIIERTK